MPLYGLNLQFGKLSEERNRVEKQNIELDILNDRVAKLEHEN